MTISHLQQEANQLLDRVMRGVFDPRADATRIRDMSERLRGAGDTGRADQLAEAIKPLPTPPGLGTFG